MYDTSSEAFTKYLPTYVAILKYGKNLLTVLVKIEYINSFMYLLPNRLEVVSQTIEHLIQNWCILSLPYI